MRYLRFFGFFIFGIGFFLAGHEASAATFTVCAAGCDFTTITDAVATTTSPGDVISVNTSYSMGGETFPFTIPTGVTLRCQNSGVTIGVSSRPRESIHTSDDVTVEDCRFSHVILRASSADNVTIQDNDLLGSSEIAVHSSDNITITRNDGILSVDINLMNVGSFTMNEILSVGPQTGALQLNNSTSVTITNNIIMDQTTSTMTNYQLVTFRIDCYDIEFSDNTITSPFLTNAGGGMSNLEVTDSRKVLIQNNLTTLHGNGGGNSINLNGIGGDISAIATHNTVRMEPSCSNCSGILVTTWTTSHLAVTSTYNLIAIAGAPSSTAVLQGHVSFAAGPASNLDLYVDYEGFAGLSANSSAAEFPIGTNATIYPYSPFKVNDVSTTNDFEQVPYSPFLDVNGSLDVGAVPGSRGNDFRVNAAGVIDYSITQATDTLPVAAALRNGDTMRISDGTYNPIYLSANSFPAPLTGSVNIIGNGAGTIIQATSTGSAFRSNISNSNVSNMTFTNSTTSDVTTYSMTRAQFSDGVTDYDDGAAIGSPDGVIVFMGPPVAFSCAASIVDADGDDVTTPVGMAMDDWNLGLIDYFGFKLTVFAPDRYVSTAADLILCAAPGAVTVEHFVPSIFTANGDGTFTYNAAAAALEGVMPKAGETTPPRIDRTVVVGTDAGIAITDGDNNTFENVILSSNAIGAAFYGSADGNTFIDSQITMSGSRDVLHDATGNQTFEDVSFTRPSALMNGTGNLTVKYSVKAHVQDGSANPVQGTFVTFKSANNLTNVALATDAGGNTALTSPLTAYVLTSASVAETAGGYNPYAISTAAVGSLQGAIASVSLNSVNQLINLVMTETPPPSGGSSGGGGGGGIGPDLPARGFQDGSQIDSALVARMLALGFAAHDLVKLPDDGNPNTQTDSTVYYLGVDGRRHAFPNPGVYFSWYCDFGSVKIISAEKLAEIPLGRNVTYRPGIRLVKFPSVPTVYLAQTGGVLVAIPSEAVAAQLLGANWNKYVSDISEAFYNDYTIHGVVMSLDDRSRFNQTPATISGNFDFSGYQESILSGAQPCLTGMPTVNLGSASWPAGIPTAFRFTSGISYFFGSGD